MTPPAHPPALHWLRASLAAVWLWTAAVSAWQWHGPSMALLAGVPARWAGAKPLLLGAGVLVDLAIGLGLWLCPGRWVYGAALLAMAGMTLGATLLQPAYWLHPFGPLSKNLVIAAALLVLWQAEPSSP